MAAATSSGLSKAGITFFGGLCAGTFGLGCWQAARYFEKVDMVKTREEELSLAPAELEGYSVCSEDEIVSEGRDGDHGGDDTAKSKRRLVGYYPPLRSQSGGEPAQWSNNRRVHVRGAFRHTDETLIGPRGPPAGSLATSGPRSGRNQGGMSSGPQGYYVVTPLERADGRGTVLVNRGWVPRSNVSSATTPTRRSRGGDDPTTATGNLTGNWRRPPGIVNVVGVTTKTERPRYFSPKHGDVTGTSDGLREKKLLWMDRPALEAATGTAGLYPILVTETSEQEGAGAESSSSSSTKGNDENPYPVRSSVDAVGEFAVTPATHFGYAVTWFGLSGAGLVMTRRLIMRGRG